MTEQDLADLLRNSREAAGLSRRDINGKLGCNRADGKVSRWERGTGLSQTVAFFRALELCGIELVVKRK